MWHGVPFACQRRPIVGVLRMCWLLPGSFDCVCCPHTSVPRWGQKDSRDALIIPTSVPRGKQSRAGPLCGSVSRHGRPHTRLGTGRRRDAAGSPFPRPRTHRSGAIAGGTPEGTGSTGEQVDDGPTLSSRKHGPRWRGTTDGNSPFLIQGRGKFSYRDYFAWENIAGGKSRHPWNSDSSRLPHAHLDAQAQAAFRGRQICQ